MRANARAGVALAFALAFAARPVRAVERGELAELPPPSSEILPLPAVPLDELEPRAPTPQWDVGLEGGIAGIGRDRPFQSVEFSGRVTADVTFLRDLESDPALGGYVGLGTVGFLDSRTALGLLGALPVLDPLLVEARAGGGLHTDGTGASPFVEGALSLGLRALNFSGHYGLTHALVIGVAHTPTDDARNGTLISLHLRVDGFWLAAPFGMIF